MAKPVVRKPKKKSNPLAAAKVTDINYKDTALLRKFISDRGKSSVSSPRPSRTPARWLCFPTRPPAVKGYSR
jgi:hypothetical protein